jgi:predicted RNA-binding Zn ribbon-like protein
MVPDVTALVSFLDTIEHGDKPDDLADPAGLARWAALEPGRASRVDLARALALRDAIREVLRDPGTPRIRGRLARASRPFTLRAGDPTIGERPLVPIGSGLHAVLGRVVADLAEARATGTIDRLKLCANCGWAFVDESRNRSRRWCEMTSCGNQSKVRAYRSRRATDHQRGGDGQLSSRPRPDAIRAASRRPR